jgi:hypothetical protein|tara:strand:- start:287 stop:400 length:114 start_codon:yes stop_codon:yes gene_type:complete
MEEYITFPSLILSILIIYLFFKRIKEKRKENFEDRDN